MANNIQIIGGRNIKVDSDCENLILINCEDQTYTSDNSNTTNIQNGALVINSDNTVTAAMKPDTEYKNADFDAVITTKIYFIDPVVIDIVVTIPVTGGEWTFVKIDATANKVILTPTSGLINGLSTFDLTAQYQKVTTVFDGTDFYV